MAAPPANWGSNFQQGFRAFSSRIQSGASTFQQGFQYGASQFQQNFQQGFSGAQNAANRASTALRQQFGGGGDNNNNFGESNNFGANNNWFGGNNSFGMGNKFGQSQMTSTNPQFGGFPTNNMNGNNMNFNNGSNFNQGPSPFSSNEKSNQQYQSSGNERRCSRKTFLGVFALLIILVATIVGAVVLINLNSTVRTTVGLTFVANNSTNAANNVAASSATLQTSSPTTSTQSDGSKQSSFVIDLTFLGSMSASEQQPFLDAQAKWESVITDEYVSQAVVPKGVEFCGPGTALSQNTNINNLLIFAQITPIDGPGGILASAAPCGFDENGHIRLGVMSFDSADFPNLVASGQISTVTLHEMGHVLGLGTAWDPLKLITALDANGDNANGPFYYFGVNGNAANAALGAGVEAVIENEGGPGTARGHWKESVYTDELMTGFINSGANPLSILSVQALADLGYVVNPDQADAYSLSRRLQEENHDDNIEMGNDLTRLPLYQLQSTVKAHKVGVLDSKLDWFRSA